MSKQCLHMKHSFSKYTTFKGVNKAEKHDIKSYYPYSFRNPYKTINQFKFVHE